MVGRTMCWNVVGSVERKKASSFIRQEDASQESIGAPFAAGRVLSAGRPPHPRVNIFEICAQGGTSAWI